MSLIISATRHRLYFTVFFNLRWDNPIVSPSAHAFVQIPAMIHVGTASLPVPSTFSRLPFPPSSSGSMSSQTKAHLMTFVFARSCRDFSCLITFSRTHLVSDYWCMSYCLVIVLYRRALLHILSLLLHLCGAQTHSVGLWQLIQLL
jgi:hypothetical protein